MNIERIKSFNDLYTVAPEKYVSIADFPWIIGPVIRDGWRSVTDQKAEK